MNSMIYHVLSFSTKESCNFIALHSVLGINITAVRKTRELGALQH